VGTVGVDSGTVIPSGTVGTSAAEATLSVDAGVRLVSDATAAGAGFPKAVGAGLPNAVGAGLPNVVGGVFPNGLGALGGLGPKKVGGRLPNAVGGALPNGLGAVGGLLPKKVGGLGPKKVGGSGPKPGVGAASVAMRIAARNRAEIEHFIFYRVCLRGCGLVAMAVV